MGHAKNGEDRIPAFVLKGLEIVDVSDAFCGLTGYDRNRFLQPGFLYELCPGGEWRYLQLIGWTSLTVRLADGAMRQLELFVEADDDRKRVEMRAHVP